MKKTGKRGTAPGADKRRAGKYGEGIKITEMSMQSDDVLWVFKKETDPLCFTSLGNQRGWEKKRTTAGKAPLKGVCFKL